MKKVFVLLIAVTFLAMTANTQALDNKKNGNSTQRAAKGVWDYQRTTVSNFDIMLSNDGKMGLDPEKNTGSGVWPRGSQNQYHYASGFWFGAMKPYAGAINKLVEISYNPNTGNSWFVPGRIEDNDTVMSSLKDKYRLYFSTDFDENTGIPFNTDDGPNWPLWIADTLKRYQYGTYRHTYVHDENARNLIAYPLGPLFVSDEDIVSTFKDTDLNFYEGGYTERQRLGYPLRLQGESGIYTWANDDMRDVVIHSYLITNTSNDTLRGCWFGGVYDLDIGLVPNAPTQAANDRTRFFDEDPTLNLAVTWTNTDKGEAGHGFGYIGISLLETPAVDANGFIRNDKLIFEPDEQIGLVSFRNWDIIEDKVEDGDRYDFLASAILDGDNGPGDKRILASTGPFNMAPGDVARVVFGIAFAMPAKGGEADGTSEDLTGFKITEQKKDIPQAHNSSLVGKILTTKDNYYQSIISGIKEKESANFSINSIYPNPVSNIFNINYELLNSGNVRMSLYDNLGKEIAVLKNELQNAGSYTLLFSVNEYNLSDGLYFLKLQIGNKIRTKKIIVVH